MFRPRLIPVLLLKKDFLVKSVQFKKHQYIGDPINAVKIFNDLKADELVFLDIDASKEKRLISLDFVKDVGEEANMAFTVGGGIKSISDIRSIINAGAEKVIIGSAAYLNENFIKDAANTFGSSTISVCIDVKKNFWGTEKAWVMNGTKPIADDVVDFAKKMENFGAGEIIIQSIARDGMMNGYDIALVKKISENLTIPVVALGGAGKLSHLKDVYQQGYANGLAAGSFFVYHDENKGVLINYPKKEDLKKLK
tara:strand:- start:18097 stop:18855 length:759 start_codon:yes stop_codon:yes gene_type:complete